MKLWVLSHLVGSPGTRRVLDAARRAGHEVELIHPLDLALTTGSDLGVRRVGTDLALPDLVFTRMGASSPPSSLNTLLHLEALGVPVVNAPRALWAARDKVRATSLLAARGLPVPASLVPGRHTTVAEVEQVLGPAPWVVKRPEGSKGEAVFLVEEPDEVLAHAAAGQAAEQPVLVQRFVAESSGVDLRVLVAGGRVLGAMRRRSGTDDFRSNLHQGGRGEPVAIDAGIRDVALAASAALGLEVAGVDLLEADEGPLVIEVNGSPGLAGIEDTTGTDLSCELIRILEERAI